MKFYMWTLETHWQRNSDVWVVEIEIFAVHAEMRWTESKSEISSFVVETQVLWGYSSITSHFSATRVFKIGNWYNQDLNNGKLADNNSILELNRPKSSNTYCQRVE